MLFINLLKSFANNDLKSNAEISKFPLNLRPSPSSNVLLACISKIIFLNVSARIPPIEPVLYFFVSKFSILPIAVAENETN